MPLLICRSTKEKHNLTKHKKELSYPSKTLILYYNSQSHRPKNGTPYNNTIPLFHFKNISKQMTKNCFTSIKLASSKSRNRQGQTQQAHFRDGAGSQHIQLMHTSLFSPVSAFKKQRKTEL